MKYILRMQTSPFYMTRMMVRMALSATFVGWRSGLAHSSFEFGFRIQVGYLDTWDLERMGHPNLTLHGRKIKSPYIDLSLVRRWVDTCESHHGGRCLVHTKPPYVKDTYDGFNLIDAANRQVVQSSDLPLYVRYLASSYVWGGVQQLTLNSGTAERLYQHGGLDDSYTDIPATIKDAMRFCEQFGVRYLWVDTLCICQDDADSLSRQIAAMDLIYQSAYLTIVVS